MYWYEGRPRFSPFWAVTRYDDVRYVSSHPELFSNGGVIRLDTDNGIARHETYKRKRAERHGWDGDVALDMLYTDPPEHLDLRSIAVRRFTPRAMGRLAQHLDELARRFVDDFVASGAGGGAGADRRGGEPVGRRTDRHHLRAARRADRRLADHPAMVRPDAAHPGHEPSRRPAR